jgi:hypothetical protein
LLSIAVCKHRSSNAAHGCLARTTGRERWDRRVLTARGEGCFAELPAESSRGEARFAVASERARGFQSPALARLLQFGSFAGGLEQPHRINPSQES